jgi:hypothetical protein
MLTWPMGRVKYQARQWNEDIVNVNRSALSPEAYAWRTLPHPNLQNVAGFNHGRSLQ